MLKRPSGTNWEFEGFKVMTDKRLLIAGGSPVPLTSKAFDTLVVLIENSDRVVTKDELLRSVWPDVEVEEGNLTQQIFLLRKALGETAQNPRCIVTIPGHGYRFTPNANAIPDDIRAPAAPIAGAAAPSAAHRPSVRAIGSGLALGMVALLAIVLGWKWLRMDNVSAPLGVIRDIARITESGKATHSAVSLDGRYVAYVENDGDEYSLFVKQVGTGAKASVVPRQPFPLAHLSFSPDGEYLYFARRSPLSPMSSLFRIPVLGGLEMPVLEDVDSPVSFSPDGREFVFHRGGKGKSDLVVAPAGGGTPRILASRTFPLGFSSFAPDWSPDGDVVAATVTDTRDGSQSIVVLPAAGGTSWNLLKTDARIGRLRWLPDGSGLLTVISSRLERRQFGHMPGGDIWHIGYPSGLAQRLTADLANHHPCCLDIGANGSVVVNVVTSLVSDLWIASEDRLDTAKQISSDHPVVSRHSWLPDNDTMVYRDLSGRLKAVNKDTRAFNLPVPDGQEVVGGVSACGDGRYVVFSTMPARNIWRVSPRAGGAKQLTNGLNDFNPACSHDGRWVYYASREPGHVSLWRVSIEGGTPTPLGLIDSYDVLPSPSGRRIYYSTDALEGGTGDRLDRWVVISSSDQAQIVAVERAGDSTIGMMTNWAPDESGLDYVVTRNGVSNIWRQPLTGGKPVQITRFHAGRIFSFAWSPDGRWLSLGSGFQRSDVVLIALERWSAPAPAPSNTSRQDRQRSR